MVYTLLFYPLRVVTEYITMFLSCFFLLRNVCGLGLSQILIKEGEIELLRPTEENKELERKKKLTLLELHGGLFL